MKYTEPLLIALLTFSFGLLSASIWFGSLGKRGRSPRVFAWPNPLRQPPQIDLRPDSPLLISNARYYSFMSIGSAVGGELRFDITNRSNKLVHSYQCRYYSAVRGGNGSHGTQPDNGLLTGQSRAHSISAHEYFPLTLTIDFVQFVDGTTWFSSSPDSMVKPDGLRAGATAAADYLVGVMNREGVESVLDHLPRIHADVRNPDEQAANPEFGLFGFYSGVTNTAVRVEHEYNDGGAKRVEAFLRSYQQ